MRYLLAIDGSEQSLEAVQVLADLCPAEKTIMLHALDVPNPTYPTMAPEAIRDLYRIVERDMRDDGQRLLDRTVTILPEGVGTVERRLELGTPSEVIVANAERERMDLIIMGARGLSPAKEIVFGSVSHRVVTHAPCAVLIVPGPMTPLRTVLLAVKGREDADTAIQFFMHKPFRNAVKVDVLTVVPLPEDGRLIDTDSEPLRDMALRSAQRFVEDIAARLSTVRCCAVPVAKIGQPAPTILKHAEELQPDLVIIGSHTGTTIWRFFMGSVSQKILHTTRRPVLTIR